MAPSEVPNPTGQANIFILAAEASPALLPLLRNEPRLASSQDRTGYSLLHALASYNHLPLLRHLVSEFDPPVDLRDSDGETALFVVETVDAAQCLIEEVGLDWRLKNNDDETAEEKIRSEGDFVTVADYLAVVRQKAGADATDEKAKVEVDSSKATPSLPKGMKLDMRSMAEEEVPVVADESFRQRIEELAKREDFEGEQGQRQLRELVQDAVREAGRESKEARPRIE